MVMGLRSAALRAAGELCYYQTKELIRERPQETFFLLLLPAKRFLFRKQPVCYGGC